MLHQVASLFPTGASLSNLSGGNEAKQGAANKVPLKNPKLVGKKTSNHNKVTLEVIITPTTLWSQNEMVSGRTVEIKGVNNGT